jgi:hypothetical protein
METPYTSRIKHSPSDQHCLLNLNYHRIDEVKEDTPETLIGEIRLTKHGSVRKQQRGFKTGDINMIVQCGTMIGDDQVFLSNKDVDREICSLRLKIKKLDRLRNRKVVIKGDSVVTCYPCNPSEIKRLQRRTCQKD